MDRRDLFPILCAGASALAQHPHAASAPAKPWIGYQPRALSREQYETLSLLAELILPHEEHSPGALDVGVPWFLDTTLYYQPAQKPRWIEGLEALAAAGFRAAEEAGRIALLTEIARHEEQPRTSLERFFGMAKSAITQAWGYSEIAQRDGLGYRGNGFLTEFRGCPHNHG